MAQVEAQTFQSRDIVNTKQLMTDIVLAILFIGGLLSLAYWFELRLHRNDFYPSNWLVLGPIPFEGAEAEARQRDFLAPFGGEARYTATPMMTHEFGADRLYWSPLTGITREVAFLSHREIIGERIQDAVAYAQTTISLPKATQLQLSIAADDGIKIWINGELVFDKGLVLPFVIDRDSIIVDLKAGENIIFVKNTQHDGGWGFALHFSDP